MGSREGARCRVLVIVDVRRLGSVVRVGILAARVHGHRHTRRIFVGAKAARKLHIPVDSTSLPHEMGHTIIRFPR